MNIVVLTADEPLYLPAFFAQFLQHRGRDTRAVFTVPSRYGKDSTFDMVRKYVSAFGWLNFAILARRTAGAKLGARLGWTRRDGVPWSLEALCRGHGIVCESAANVNAVEFLERLRAMGTDLLVSVSCPQVFRRPLIELPPRGCLNVHGALLPKYRGIAPSFWMMAQGETQAGVTVFLVNEDIDAGDVVEQVAFPIGPTETLHEFIIRSKRIACEALLRAIDAVERGTPMTRPLDKAGGSYFSFPTRAAYRAFRQRGRRLW